VNLKTIIVDGISIETTEQGSQAIDKLNKALADALGLKTTAENTLAAKLTEHKTALDAATAENATLKQQLKDSAITPAKLRDAARAYATTIAQAKILAPTLKIDDAMDTPAIQKAVVLAKMGDAAKDWNDSQFDTSFKSFAASIPADKLKAADAGADPLRAAMIDGGVQMVDGDGGKAAKDAYAKMIEDMQTAHLPSKAA
jgi:hypothetical protein